MSCDALHVNTWSYSFILFFVLHIFLPVSPHAPRLPPKKVVKQREPTAALAASSCFDISFPLASHHVAVRNV